MNDAVSTIALGVDTKSGKEHLLELKAAFAGLRQEMELFNAVRTNPDSVVGGTAKVKSELATLSAEYKKAQDQITDLTNQIASLSRAQTAAVQNTATASKAASKITIESEKAAAEATQKLARETTKVVQEESAKRYSMGQSARVGNVSYSMRAPSNENELTQALRKAESERLEILSNSRVIQMADIDRAEALRIEKNAVAQAMLIAETERAEVRKREINQTAQAMLIADIDRAEQRKLEVIRNARVMQMADIDRAELQRIEKQRIANDMLMAVIDRNEALQREQRETARVMLIAETERAEARKREKNEVAQAMLIADIDRAEQEKLEVIRNARIIQMAEIDRADEKRLERQRISNAMMIAETERAERIRQAILDNDYATGTTRQRFTASKRASGLVNSGDDELKALAKSRYGQAAIDGIGNLAAMESELNTVVNKGNGLKEEARKHTQQWAGSMRDAHSAARGLAGGLGQIWLTWGNIVPLIAGAAVTGSMAKVFTVGKEVEFQLQFLRALSDDVKANPVDLDSFLRITDGTLSSVKEAAEGMRALSQAGLSQKQALAALPDVLDLAVVGEMGVAEAALTATGVLQAFNMEITESSKVGDVFSRIAAASNTSVAAMTESMKQASTVGEQFDLSMEEASATMGLLAQRNIIGSSAGTSLTNALKSLYEPTEQARKAMAQLNITTDDGNGGLKSYTQLMGELASKMSTLNDSGKAVFLGAISDQRGAKTLSAITENFGKYQDFLDKASSSAGFMSHAMLELEDTVEGSTRRMKNSLENSFLKAFQESSPIIREVMGDLNQLAKSEEVVDMLSSLAVAGARVTKTLIENVDVIVTAAAAYAGLKVVGGITSSFLVYRATMQGTTVATVAAAGATSAHTVSLEAQAFAATGAGIAMTRLAAGTRMATAAMGPVAILAMAAYTAYELWNSSIDVNENNLRRANNTIDTALDYYDRQIAKLEELNKQLRESGNEAEIAANKTAKATLQAALVTAEQDVEAARAKGDKQVRGTVKYDRQGNAIAHNIAETDLDKALIRYESIKGKLEEVERDEIKISELKSETLARQNKQSVNRRIDDMIEQAGGGIFQDRGNEKTRALIPILEEYKRQLAEGDEGMYLHIAPKLKEIKDQINESTNDFSAIDPKGVGDGYRALQIQLDGKIQEIKDLEKSRLSDIKSKLSVGEIGDLQAIAESLKTVKKAREDELNVLMKKEEVAAKAENRKADYASINNKAEANQRLDTESEKDADRQRRELFAKWNADNLQESAKVLREKGQLVQAFLAEYDAKFAAEESRIAADLLKVPAADYEGWSALKGRQKKIGDGRDSGTNEAKFAEAKVLFDSLMDSMDEQIATVMDKASSTNGFLSDLGAAQEADDIRAQLIPAINGVLEQMQKLAGDNPAMKGVVSRLGTDIIKEAERSKKSWIETGKSIEKSLTDAFGKGGKAVGGVVSALIRQKAEQKDIDDQLKKAKADPKKTLTDIELETKAREASAQVQLSSYGSIAGAAKGFFDEQSRGYAALEAAEKTFRAFEIAMALQTHLTKSGFLTAFTGLFAASKSQEVALESATVAPKLAAESAKQGANGITALTEALKLPFPASIPAYAVIAAMLASIGVAVAGGGGSKPSLDIAKERQKYQGTGHSPDLTGEGESPFEWELKKSESIARSLEAMRDNSDIALSYSSSQLATLELINSGISGMASMVTMGTGLRGTYADQKMLGIGSTKGALGFNSSSTELQDIGIIFDTLVRRSGTVEADESEDFFGVGKWNGGRRPGTSILEHMPQTVGSVMAGGVQARSYADLKITESSWWGLDEDTDEDTKYGEVQQAFKDQMTSVITGMYSSVLSAAKFLGKDESTLEQSLKNVSLESAGLTKISLKGLSNDEIEDELGAVFGNLGDQMAKVAMPGLEGWKKASEGYLETLIRVSNGVDVAAYSLEKLGISAVAYTEVANKQGDVTTEIIRASLMYKEANNGVLNGIGQMVSTFAGSANELTDAYTKLNDIRRTMQATGMTDSDVTRDMVRGAGGLEELASGMQSYLENFFSEGERSAAKVAMLQQEFAKLNVALPTSKEQFREIVEGIDRSTTAGQALFGTLMGLAEQFAEVSDSAGALNPALAKQRSIVMGLIDLANKWMETSRNAKSLLNDLDEALSTSGTRDTASRMAELQELMASGTISFDQQLELAGELKDLILEKYQLEKENAQDLIDFGRDLRDYTRDLRTGDKSPLTNAEKLEEANAQFNQTLSDLSSSDENVRERARDQIQDKADTLLELARTFYASSSGYTDIFNRVTGQLDTIGQEAIDTVSLEDLSADQLQELVQLRGAVNDIWVQANAEYNSAKLQLGNQLGVLEDMYIELGILSEVPELLRTMPAELAAAMAQYVSGVGGDGINQTTTDRLKNLYQSVLGREADQAGLEFWISKMAQGVTIGQVEAALKNSQEYQTRINGSHATGLDYVPYDGYVAELHHGERVLTANQARRQDKAAMASTASFSASERAEMAAEIRGLRGTVEKLIESQDRNAAALAQSFHQSVDGAADKIVDGTGEAVSAAGWTEKNKPSFV